ncbi:MAG: hypothetical protein ACFFAY_16300 [Promethearchaeota archaeon]
MWSDGFGAKRRLIDGKAVRFIQLLSRGKGEKIEVIFISRNMTHIRNEYLVDDKQADSARYLYSFNPMLQMSYMTPP